MFSFGPCQDPGGVTSFVLSASFPQATAVPPAVSPPFVDIAASVGWAYSPTIKLAAGLWQVKFEKVSFPWQGPTGFFPGFPPDQIPYPIYDQRFSAFISDTEPDESGNLYIPTSWPCSNGSIFTAYGPGDFFAYGTMPRPTDPFRACQLWYSASFGCPSCQMTWAVMLTVGAATTIYGANARAFKVIATGVYLG